MAIAERLRNSGKRVQNIEVTNAVEALACWLALDSNGWKRDPRLRGALKLFGKEDRSSGVEPWRGRATDWKSGSG